MSNRKEKTNSRKYASCGRVICSIISGGWWVIKGKNLPSARITVK